MRKHLPDEVVAGRVSLYPDVFYFLHLAPDSERTENLAQCVCRFPPLLHYDIARFLHGEKIPAYLHELVRIGRNIILRFLVFREQVPYPLEFCFCHTVISVLMTKSHPKVTII